MRIVTRGPATSPMVGATSRSTRGPSSRHASRWMTCCPSDGEPATATVSASSSEMRVMTSSSQASSPSADDVGDGLGDHVDDREPRDGIAVEHVDDLAHRGIGADDDRAVQEVPVAALVSQPRAQAPAHDEEQEQAERERDEDEAAREVELEGEDDDRDGAEDGRGGGDDALELLRADAEHARVVGTPQDQHDHPGRDDDEDEGDVGRVVDLDRVGDGPAQDEAR